MINHNLVNHVLYVIYVGTSR